MARLIAEAIQALEFPKTPPPTHVKYTLTREPRLTAKIAPAAIAASKVPSKTAQASCSQSFFGVPLA